MGVQVITSCATSLVRLIPAGAGAVAQWQLKSSRLGSPDQPVRRAKLTQAYQEWHEARSNIAAVTQSSPSLAEEQLGGWPWLALPLARHRSTGPSAV